MSNNINIDFLAIKIKDGNQKAFTSLFEVLWEPLFVFAKSMLMDEQNAKDVVQDIWVDYWKRKDKISPTFIKAYLFKAVKNKVYTHFRDNQLKPEQVDILHEISSEFGIEEQYDYEHTLLHINKVTDDLPKRCKEIFTLSKLRGLTNDEIATDLGISKRSVENQLSFAIAKLKKSF